MSNCDHRADEGELGVILRRLLVFPGPRVGGRVGSISIVVSAVSGASPTVAITVYLPTVASDAFALYSELVSPGRLSPSRATCTRSQPRPGLWPQV